MLAKQVEHMLTRQAELAANLAQAGKQTGALSGSQGSQPQADDW